MSVIHKSRTYNASTYGSDVSGTNLSVEITLSSISLRGEHTKSDYRRHDPPSLLEHLTQTRIVQALPRHPFGSSPTPILEKAKIRLATDQVGVIRCLTNSLPLRLTLFPPLLLRILCLSPRRCRQARARSLAKSDCQLRTGGQDQ